MPCTRAFANVANVFPATTVVGAYPKTNWLQGQLPPAGVPQGAATETATVAVDGSLTFLALLPNTTYYLYAQVGGVDRYMRTVTPKLGRVQVKTAGTVADQTIRAAVPGRQIRLLGHTLSAGGAVTCLWKSGAANEIGGPLKFADTGGLSHPSEDEAPALETRPGEALVMNTAQAIVVGGQALYTLEPAA